MGLLDIVRAGVQIADSLTRDLQASVSHASYIADSETSYGEKQWAAPVSRPALVTLKQKQVRNEQGELLLSTVQVVFLDAAVVVTMDDKIVLPDGSTGAILDVEGFIDRGTGLPILREVYLG